MSSTTTPPPQAPGGTPPQDPTMTPAPGAQQQQQGLPPTGLQQQLASLNQFYGQVQNAQLRGSASGKGGGIGFNVHQMQFGNAQAGGTGELSGDQEIGSNTLDGMARNLAQRYGLPVGRGRIVDESGNFLMTPQQLADASGGQVSQGEAAAQMNYISQAVTRKQNEDQQKKGIAALQTGLGQVQSRGRGSMAGMMSGYYEGIADMYANQEYEAADFSFYIQQEQQQIEAELQRRAERLSKKQAQGNFVAGIGVTIAGLYTGNVAAIAQGASMVGGSAGATGWF